MRRGQQVSWADMGVIAQSVARLGQSVVLTQPPRADTRQTAGPWPTQGPKVRHTPVAEPRPPSTPWPSKARASAPKSVSNTIQIPEAETPATATAQAEVAAEKAAAEQVAAEKAAAQRAAEAAAAPAPAAPAPKVESHTVAEAQPPRPAVHERPVASSAVSDATAHTPEDEYDAATEERVAPLRAARVPSSRLGRLLHYGSLGAGLAWGSAGEYMRRATSGSSETPSPVFLSEANVNRLVDKLSTMRGAALKLGQFMSIQDSHMLPPQVEEVMLRVQNSAHYMPAWQLEQVMQADLGDDWRTHFSSFEERPFAAASIGQVHSAVLADPFPAQPHMAGKRVAVKVQFPGVAQSISSDLSNIKWLLMASALLPKGLFLENSVRVLQKELEEECDYTREAEMGRRFRAHVDASATTSGALRLEVPEVVDSLCTPRVLTTEFMRGRPLTHAARLDQATRDRIAHAIMELSLRELFEWRLMQTDPNWTNFLYSEKNNSIQLIDFGASRPYSAEFMDMWVSLLRAAVAGDREACEKWSIAIGYLTGEESESMRTAHLDSMVALGEPFRADAPVPYPFANQTITDRVRAQIPVMLRERHRPPPPETYSLNRKLSGAFLLCARLGASVDCRSMFDRVTSDYVYAGGSTAPPAVPGTRRNMHSMARRLATAGLRAPRALHTVPHQHRIGRNIGDRWAKMALNDYVVQQAQHAEPTPPKPKSQPTAMPWSAGGIRTERPGSVMIRGVEVPIRPSPPGPEDCCMSGCVNCVYNLYADDVEDWKEDITKARAKLEHASPPITVDEWDTTKFGRLPAQVVEPDKEAAAERAIGPEDPVLKAFMHLEQDIKRKHRQSPNQREANSKL